jgi:hypothetical protein
MTAIASIPPPPPLFQPAAPDRAVDQVAEKATEKQRLDQVQISQEAQQLARGEIERGLA